MTYPPDYHQQLYAYLQAWRQFLEPLTAIAAMAAGMPVPPGPWAGPGTGMYPMPAAPGLPPYPAAPVAPPQMPAADYTQQLFGYLQGWRQQLEQMTGTAPPTTSGNDAGTPGRRPVPPDRTDGGRASPSNDGPGSLYPRQTTSASVEPPKFAAMRPANAGGSQVPGDQLQSDSLRQAAVVARGPVIAAAPIAELGRIRQRDVSAPRATGTPVTRVATPAAAVSAVPRSNFAGIVTRALNNVERG